MFDPLTPGIVTRGVIIIRHMERAAPLLTFPAGTYWQSQPTLPDGVYLESLPNTNVREQPTPLEREHAQLETLRWHMIVTSPMPSRIVLFLEFVGGGSPLLQPEIADLICVSQDCLKRAVAHYRTLGRVRTNPRGLWLQPVSSRIWGLAEDANPIQRV